MTARVRVSKTNNALNNQALETVLETVGSE